MKPNNFCFLFFLFIIISRNIFSQTNPNGWDTAWVNSYGGIGTDIGRDLKETSDHGFILLGTTSSFGNGNTSFYLIKTDSIGGHEWSKALGSENNDIAYTLEIAQDGGYFLAGTTNWNQNNGYDGFLIKTDNLGNVIWTKNYGGNDWDFIYNSCKVPNNCMILCGESYSNSKGLSDAYLIKIDINGDTLWTRRIGDVGMDAFYSVEYLNNKIYAVGKQFNAITNKYEACIYKFDLNGNVLSFNLFSSINEDLEYHCVSFTNSGKMLLGGKKVSNNNPFYILRQVDTLSYSQLNSISSTQNFYFNCVFEGFFNDIYCLTTSFGGLGGLSAQYLRFNSGFGYLTSANFGGVEDEEASFMIKTSRGYALIGTTKSYGNINKPLNENLYFVVFNRKSLVADYFILKNEFEDNLSPIGVKKIGKSHSDLKIFPIPFKTECVIELSDDFNGREVILNLIDSYGKIILQMAFNVVDNRIIIDRKNLTSGCYYFNINCNSIEIQAGKIIVE